MNRTSAYASLACAALAAACSAEPKVGSTATALDYCKTSSGISADKAGQCLKMAPAVVALAASPVSADGEAYCDTVKTEVDAGRVVYDAAKGSSCARALASLAPCALFGSSAQFPEDCRGVLAGTVALGSPCFEYMDCTSGYCNAPLACGGPKVSGQCVAYSTEGEPCSGGACAEGLGCTYAAATPVCVPLAGEGGACPCQEGLYCDTTGGTPICKTPKTSGPCSAPFAPGCAPGYACFGSPASCVPYVGLGASCGAAGVCGPGYECDSGSRACVAQPTVGQACVISRSGTAAQLGCIGGAWCDAAGTGTCQPWKADGEPCTSNLQCDGSCDTLTQACKDRPPLGCATPL